MPIGKLVPEGEGQLPSFAEGGWDHFARVCMTTDLASPEDTLAFGRALAAELKAGDVSCSSAGQLGAGQDARGEEALLAGLGSPEDVTSPTFSLVHEYRRARLPVFHFDFYRMKREGRAAQHRLGRVSR